MFFPEISFRVPLYSILGHYFFANDMLNDNDNGKVVTQGYRSATSWMEREGKSSLPVFKSPK